MSIHLKDKGTAFQLICQDGAVVLDVTAATTLELYLQKPNNGAIVGPKTLTKPNGGTDGLVAYTFLVGELDPVGEWTYQVKLTFPTGIWSSDWGKFTVYPNLWP